MEEAALKLAIEKLPLSDAVKNAISIDKLHAIVSGGIVQLKNMGVLDVSNLGVADKYPQIQDVIAVAGKFAAALAPFKVGGSDKQAVVLGLIDVMLEYIGSFQASLKPKLDAVRETARTTLPAVLTLAVSAARGNLSKDLQRKPGESIADYARSLGRTLISFARRLTPSFALCGLSTAAVDAVLDRGEAIVGPVRTNKAPVESDSASVGSVQSEKEQPHYTTPRQSIDEGVQISTEVLGTAMKIPESILAPTVEETPRTTVVDPPQGDDKEPEIRPPTDARTVLYSA
jgi:hypothetical protein